MTRYGLPEKVLFCWRCVISNQRPSSCNEFEHTANSKKVGIHFDAEGICDACRVAEAKQSTDWAERERELKDLLDQYRSTDGSFDVLVPGSGGKDSYYAAHVLRHKYGMHPLLCTWSATLYTDWGWRNLQRWQRIAPHIQVTPGRDVQALLTRLSMENLFHPFATFIYGQKGMPPKLAARYGIKLVMYGENEAEYGNPKEDSESAIRAASYFSTTNAHLGGCPVQELRERYKLTSADLAPYMPPQPHELYNVDVRYLGYYLKWHPQSAYYYAVEHGDFECSPERTPGTWSKYNSIDDKIDDFHYWTTFQKFGIGRATYDAAQEIRSGDITREEGVSLVRRYDGEYPERFEGEVLRYLSVPGFVPATKGWLLDLAARFRPAHLFDGEKVRHRVDNLPSDRAIGHQGAEPHQGRADGGLACHR